MRGMRIRVSDVLDLLAAGLSMAQIVEEMPDLEVDDIKACLAYARRKIDHPSIAAWRFGWTPNCLRERPSGLRLRLVLRQSRFARLA